MSRKSITTKLFNTYAMFFSFLFSALFILSIAYIGITINSRIVKTQEQTLSNINKNIESFFKEMNDFSLSLSTSKEFKKLSLKTIPEEYRLNKPLGSNFTEMYLIANKMFEKKYRIGVYLPSGDYIWMGSNYFINNLPDLRYKEIFNGYKFGEFKVEVIENNQFLEQSIIQNPYSKNDLGKVLSITRTLHNNLPVYHADGLLDVQISYDDFENYMQQICTENDIQISIYNKSGLLLYGSSNDVFEDKFFLQNSRDQGLLNKKELHSGNYIKAMPLLFSNLYVVSSVSYYSLYKSMIIYIVLAILIFILLNVMLLLVTYKMSVRVAKPLKSICREIEKIRFDSAEKEIIVFKPVETDIDEILLLSDTIVKMQNKLGDSMEEIVCLRSYEIQSQMLSLQAQMQPHFLYNTLMTIAAMAEEEGINHISKMCEHLTNMLRYISSTSIEGVLMAEEISHIRDYISIMKERFPKTEIEYQIPMELYSITIPKLIIQPLVENSLKYCNRLNCQISITGCIEDGRWRIAVSDNGIGFTEEKIEEVMLKCEQSFENYQMHSLEINGMGLANIYSRLKISYGEHMTFKIDNNHNEGSSIQIGGVL